MACVNLEVERLAILARKKDAETCMHNNSKQVYVYQREFEVHQRAFFKAISDLDELDIELLRLRRGDSVELGNGKDAGNDIVGKLHWQSTESTSDSSSEW